MQRGTRTGKYRFTRIAAGAVLLGLGLCVSASATTFSLSGNWATTANPNGAWSYRHGTTLLPAVADWTAGGTGFQGCNQPAWAPSNNPGNFLPAMVKANACTAKFLGTDPHNGLGNVDVGDIVVHTVDSFNGNPSIGVANFLFKVPTGDAGVYRISGSVWDASLFYGTARPQDWALLVNGVVKASGVLNGTISRSEAKTFNVTATLVVGATVELELYQDASAAAGFFVGTNMTITPVPPACALTDTPSYDATTGVLTMKFAVATPTAATWNGWLTVKNAVDPLWSQALPVTEPEVTKIETHAVPKSGVVGILSTLTTATQGITCSSWQTINTP
jgi:hypothetical protein